MSQYRVQVSFKKGLTHLVKRIKFHFETLGNCVGDVSSLDGFIFGGNSCRFYGHRLQQGELTPQVSRFHHKGNKAVAQAEVGVIEPFAVLR